MNGIIKFFGSRFAPRTLTSDLTVGLVLSLSAAIVLTVLIQFYFTVRQQEERLLLQADLTAQNMAKILSGPLWALDEPTIRRIGDSFLQSESVKSIIILNESDQVLYNVQGEETDLISATRDVLYNGIQIGWVEVALSRSEIRRDRSIFISYLLLVIVVIVITLRLVTGFIIQKYITEPVKVLTRRLDTIATGAGFEDLQIVPQADINLVFQRINQIAHRIDRQVEDLQRETAERKLIEQELRRYQGHLEELVSDRTAELEAINKELESFSYSISHDLRTPLRHVDGYTAILQEDFQQNLPPEAQQYLLGIRNEIRHMNDLINGLLNLSRLTRKPIDVETVDLKPLIEFVLRDLAAEQTGRSLEIHLGDLPPCEADPLLLRQVYTNLISNALKYTRTRQPAAIEIGSTRQDDRLVYFVRDNGIGFSMESAPKLFGVFQRLHSDKEYEGTGIGLAIVQRIIHRHGGKIWAEAAVDAGATFYFTLPANHRD